VSKSVIHPFYVTSHCSLFRCKHFQRAKSSLFYDLLVPKPRQTIWPFVRIIFSWGFSYPNSRSFCKYSMFH
jgi:hypothetical protein